MTTEIYSFLVAAVLAISLCALRDVLGLHNCLRCRCEVFILWGARGRRSTLCALSQVGRPHYGVCYRSEVLTMWCVPGRRSSLRAMLPVAGLHYALRYRSEVLTMVYITGRRSTLEWRHNLRNSSDEIQSRRQSFIGDVKNSRENA